MGGTKYKGFKRPFSCWTKSFNRVELKKIELKNASHKKTLNMRSNIIFVGGIHGVGKSTICQKICTELNLEYLSASELLKWQEINEDSKNKKVKDISDTQNRLILGLTKRVQKDRYYLIDGHYCLLNSKSEIGNVPLETFKLINPIALGLILGDILEIKNRLEKRDGKSYDKNLLEQMQKNELNHAEWLSKILGVSLNMGTQNDYSKLLTSFRGFLTLEK